MNREERLRQLARAIDAVSAIHTNEAGTCLHCRTQYPCATARALQRNLGDDA